MPYAPNFLVQANGVLPGGEKWSCSTRYSVPGNSYTPAQVQAAANGARVPWANFIGIPQSYCGENVGLTTVYCRLVNPATPSAAGAESAAAGPTYGSGTTRMPNEVALVLSLRSDVATKSGRGRIYLPTLALQMGATGVINSTAAGQIAGAFKTCLLDVRTALATALGESSVDVVLVVASAVQGVNYPVTTIKVGNVPDVQRRRQFDLPESFVVSTFPT